MTDLGNQQRRPDGKFGPAIVPKPTSEAVNDAATAASADIGSIAPGEYGQLGGLTVRTSIGLPGGKKVTQQTHWISDAEFVDARDRLGVDVADLQDAYAAGLDCGTYLKAREVVDHDTAMDAVYGFGTDEFPHWTAIAVSTRGEGDIGRAFFDVRDNGTLTAAPQSTVTADEWIDAAESGGNLDVYDRVRWTEQRQMIGHAEAVEAAGRYSSTVEADSYVRARAHAARDEVVEAETEGADLGLYANHRANRIGHDEAHLVAQTPLCDPWAYANARRSGSDPAEAFKAAVTYGTDNSF